MDAKDIIFAILFVLAVGILANAILDVIRAMFHLAFSFVYLAIVGIIVVLGITVVVKVLFK